ncbi:MAG: hypothetical protein HN742_08750 [Lentisphaerae bacterium]|jgi:hypothetical protein|nr:hypothetical protein [Lentisphaerota bacterium]MBT5611187.1 hypothetical protein [Lentisphaerota bacterium]MBT7054689.1 hypothetical protein [Lentisphaerota bacterium]MBT7841947.1 hypothetical protein [Lentisphaerota bacterium]
MSSILPAGRGTDVGETLGVIRSFAGVSPHLERIQRVNSLGPRLSTVVLSTLLLLSAPNREMRAANVQALSPPPAPFAVNRAAARASVVVKTPVVRGNGIFFGDKGLIIDNSSRLSLVSGGGELAAVLPCVRTAYSVNVIPSTSFRDGALTSGKEPGAFTYEGQVPLDQHGAMGTWRQNVTVLPDGRIRLDCALSVPAAGASLVSSAMLLFKLPFAVCADRRFSIDDREYAFTAGSAPSQTNAVLFASSNVRRLRFAPGDPEATFDMALLRKRALTIREELKDNWEGQMVYLSVEADAQREISLVLDLRTISAAARTDSADAHNGIDFWKSDRLHVPNYGLCRNLIQNPSFEAGLYHYQYAMHGLYYENGPADLYTVDDRQAYRGKRSLRIRAVKGMGYPHGLASFAIPVVEGRTYTFSCYARGDLPGLRLTVRGISADWPVFPLVSQTNVTTAWDRYSFSFTAPNAGISIGLRGAYYGDDASGQGTVWVDGLQLEEGGMTDYTEKPFAASVVSSRPGSVFAPGERMACRLHLAGRPGTTGEVAVSVEDFFYRTVWRGEFAFTIDGGGQADIPLPLDRRLPRGVFVVRADVALRDGFSDTIFSRIAIMPPLDNRHRNKALTSVTLPKWPCREAIFERGRAMGIGSQTAITRDFPEEEMDLMRRYGMESMGTAIMNDVSNGCIQVEGQRLVPGLLKLTHVTAEVEQAVEEASYLKAKSLPWIDMWWFAGESAPRYRAHGVKGASLVPHNIPDFAKLILACRRGVKRANPQARFLAVGGPCNMSPGNGIDLLDRYVRALGTGVRFDGVGIHPYRALPENPDLDDDATVLRSMLAKHGWGEIPVYWNEGIYHHSYVIPAWGLNAHRGASKHCRIGPVSYHMGWGERICAAYYARYWLVGLKHQEQVKCFDGHWALMFLDVDLAPFAFQKIPNTLGRLLGNASFRRDIRFAPQVRGYVFEDERGRPVAALWSHRARVDRGDEPPPVALIRFAGAMPEFFDLMEAPRSVAVHDDGACRVPVSPFPLFIRGRPGTLESLCQSLNTATLVGDAVAPLDITAKPTGMGDVEIQFRNLLTRPFRGKAVVRVQDAPLTQALELAVKERFALRVPLPAVLSSAHISELRLPVHITGHDGSFVETDVSFRGFAVNRRPASRLVVDGDLADWGATPEIAISSVYDYGKAPKQADQQEGMLPFSATFRMAWDDQNLYLAVCVTDETLSCAKGGGPNNWNNDCLQVYIDTCCDARSRATEGYDSNDYNYDFCRDPAALDTATPWRMVTPEEQLTGGVYGLKNRQLEPGIATAFREVPGGYVYEIAFPARFIQPVRLQAGTVVGFALFLSDDDGKGIETSLTLTPPGTSCHMKPHLWPVMLLVE